MFKAQLALANLHVNKTRSELFSQLERLANQVTQLKRQLLERLADVPGAAVNQITPTESLVISHGTAYYLPRLFSDTSLGRLMPSRRA